MGIKTAITKEKLPYKYREYKLIETQDGVSHSVYLLDNKFVLKLLENTSFKTIKNEQVLLEGLATQNLNVPKIVDIYKEKEDDYYMVFYTQIEGKSIYNPSASYIKQIALFLKKFHSFSLNKTSTNEKIYTKNYLKKMIDKANNPILTNYYKSIECTLQNDGIIHGDLFYDNAKFYKETLSGVYDFIEACEGDFLFELAVVTISWCFQENKLDKEKVMILLENYETNISFTDFKEYIKYALLYYTTQRYLHNRNYKELLNKMESL